MKLPLVVSAVFITSLSGCGCSNGVDADVNVKADDTPVQHADVPQKPPHGCGGGFWSVHYRDAYKTLREAEEYKPGLRDYYVRTLSDRWNEYLEASISPKTRERWLKSHNVKEKDLPCIVPLFDEIEKAAKRTLPTYRPRGYKYSDGEAKSLIKEAVEKVAGDVKFLGVGLLEKSWEIEKLRNGVPSVRYKHGVAWVKGGDKHDDGYCRIYYVNVLEDYAGGGSYGDAYANFIRSEPAGCD